VRGKLGLGAVLLVAAVLRLFGLEWGFPRCYHPDEWIYSWNAAAMLERGDFELHSRPIERRYVNPTGFVYATELGCAFVDAWENDGRAGGAGALDRYREHRADWHLVSRVLSACLGTLAVGLVWRAGRSLEASGAARGTALIAAGLLALSPLHVRDSHFGTSDVPASCAIAFSLVALLGYRSRPTLARAVLVGASIGIAVATKYSAGLVLVPALAVAIEVAGTHGGRALARDVAGAALALGVGFLVLSPAPLIDREAFFESFRYQASLARVPYEGQDPIPSWLFHARTLALGLGPLGLGASLAGLALLAGRRGGIAVAGLPLAHFGVFVPMPFAFARVDVPVLPPLALAAGFAIALALSSVKSKAGVSLALVLALGPPALLSVRIDHLLREPDTRLTGEEWLRARVSERPLLAFDAEGQRGVMPLGASGNFDPGLPTPIALRMDGPEIVDRLEEAHVRWVVLTSGDEDEPLSEGARAFMRTLRARAKPVLEVDAGFAGEHVPYASEERYAPFEHAFARVRPGPPIRVYELSKP
jgi:hypothetical protein